MPSHVKEGLARDSESFKAGINLGRFVAGGGFMLVGLVFVGIGIGMLVSPMV